MTLAERFNPRANGLNLLRLILATSVIVGHSFPLAGQGHITGPLGQVLDKTPVDGFFAISGFLIASSWMRRPEVWPFLSARFLRIFPGFLVCLVLTAMVLAPIGILLSGQGFPSGYAGGAIEYVVRNASLTMFQYDIAGTPANVPYDEVWNGSLWTLRWEFLCYLGILALGLVGALRRTWAILGLFLLAVAGLALVGAGQLTGDTVTNVTRFGVMFLAGTLVYILRERLPSGPVWLILSAAIVALSYLIEPYQIVAGPFLAYLLIAGSAYITAPALRLKNDISYGVYIYAFPVAQILVLAGMDDGPIVLFVLATIAITIPLAAGSWFAIEKPAMRLRNIRRPRTVQEVAVTD